ncbi:hypothetical protein [Maribacter halichondriae]|nr:hypothetical protein [Maribacter sp. Hal144]
MMKMVKQAVRKTARIQLINHNGNPMTKFISTFLGRYHGMDNAKRAA